MLPVQSAQVVRLDDEQHPQQIFPTFRPGHCPDKGIPDVIPEQGLAQQQAVFFLLGPQGLHACQVEVQPSPAPPRQCLHSRLVPDHDGPGVLVFALDGDLEHAHRLASWHSGDSNAFRRGGEPFMLPPYFPAIGSPVSRIRTNGFSLNQMGRSWMLAPSGHVRTAQS